MNTMEHYFSSRPASPAKGMRFPSIIAGIRCNFQSAGGVFSKDGLDPGAYLLVQSCLEQDLAERRVLDLGCGIGVVGIFIARKFASARVFFSDVNQRALALAKRNINENRIEGTVLVSDGFAHHDLQDARFDLIAFNPPQHAGKDLCNRLIADAIAHLAPRGKLLLVARHNKGGSSFCAVMEEAAGNASSVAKKGMFRVYASVKNA